MLDTVWLRVWCFIVFELREQNASLCNDQHCAGQLVDCQKTTTNVAIFSDTTNGINVKHWNSCCYCIGVTVWYFSLSFTYSYHLQWPWPYFRVMAVSDNFNWQIYVLNIIQLSLCSVVNYVNLILWTSYQKRKSFSFIFICIQGGLSTYFQIWQKP